MKRVLITLTTIFITANVWAQSPEKMSYQAVIRNSSNALVVSQGIGMQISILQGSATGTAVYEETQSPTTNANGLVSVEIGTGTVISGDFALINWENGPYFIKTETDPTTAGGTTYTITGTSQLMSVPYALHAKTAESITGTINYTETDPVFGASIANGITALDTTNWNTQVVDTDTHIDSTGIATLGFVAGAHTVDTDTHIDAAGVTALGFSTGVHTTDSHIDSTGIATLGFVAGAHTIDTDTQLDSTGVTSLGFVAGPHTVDTDTHIDAAGVTALGFSTGVHTTDSHIDSTGIATLGFVAGAHTIDTDTQLDSTGVTSLGFVAGAHTVDTDTHIDAAGVTALGFSTGVHTTDSHIDSTGIATLGFVADAHTVEIDGSITNELQTISRTGTTVTLSNGGGTFSDSVNTYIAGANVTISTSNVISATSIVNTYTAGANVTISASNVISAASGGSTDSFYLGQDTLGGIVYYIYKDSTGTQHGLIVNKTQSTASWQASGTLTSADRSEDGVYNTALMTSSLAATYVTSLGTGWYLPSIDELGLLYYNRFTTNKSLRVGGNTLLKYTSNYWSSTEYNTTYSLYFSFQVGHPEANKKFYTIDVRAVRSF